MGTIVYCMGLSLKISYAVGEELLDFIKAEGYAS